MLYPIYVHLGDDTHAHSATFPDFPGCFSAADELNDLPAAVQEAVEAHFSDGEEVPAPSDVTTLAANPDYQGGLWMLFDIDLSKVSTKSMRLNITLPENLVHEIDAFAKAHHMTRSGFLAQAANKAMQH
ncbi:type II toxin-antitoxin system HicB family antitoxin [Solimicrobium silvestre]|uniref:HicB-like antitoxin of toxin-antitoxin system domain-containing protein n=1 Tax=Solimicrobium silvestre TaxID=2099400 RepID=A0A2S9GZG3_9BURK|nr:type II toxin-antitoxin system HicB family antitoxin [Solimicrobium silvestre]PRC93097.1 hypothetical protein S2091_2183 [Solimicrobium silvestre]